MNNFTSEVIAQFLSKENNFSTRKHDVLIGILKDTPIKEIADKMQLTEKGVKYHISHIYAKLGLKVTRRRDFHKWLNNIYLSPAKTYEIGEFLKVPEIPDLTANNPLQVAPNVDSVLSPTH